METLEWCLKDFKEDRDKQIFFTERQETLQAIVKMSQIEKVDEIDFESLSLAAISIGLGRVDPDRHFDFMMCLDLDKLTNPLRIALICFRVLESCLERALQIFSNQQTSVSITKMVLAQFNRLIAAHLSSYGNVEFLRQLCSGKNPVLGWD